MSEALDQKLSALKLARIRQVYPSWVEVAPDRGVACHLYPAGAGAIVGEATQPLLRMT